MFFLTPRTLDSKSALAQGEAEAMDSYEFVRENPFSQTERPGGQQKATHHIPASTPKL